MVYCLAAALSLFLSLSLVMNAPAAGSQRQSDWNNYNLPSAPETAAPPACNTINCMLRVIVPSGTVVLSAVY